jgi:hypothetical protein
MLRAVEEQLYEGLAVNRSCQTVLIVLVSITAMAKGAMLSMVSTASWIGTQAPNCRAVITVALSSIAISW